MLSTYLESWTPSQRFSQTCMECTKVDECVGCQEEIRNQRSNQVEFADKDESARISTFINLSTSAKVLNTTYAIAMKNVKMYPRTGSLFFPYPLANHSNLGYNLSLQRAWNTLGADTKLANADDSVAAKHPA